MPTVYTVCEDSCTESIAAKKGMPGAQSPEPVQVAKRQRLPSWNHDWGFLLVQEQDEEERGGVLAVINFSLHQIPLEGEKSLLRITHPVVFSPSNLLAAKKK
jgi:hypothetical protein